MSKNLPDKHFDHICKSWGYMGLLQRIHLQNRCNFRLMKPHTLQWLKTWNIFFQRFVCTLEFRIKKEEILFFLGFFRLRLPPVLLIFKKKHPIILFGTPVKLGTLEYVIQGRQPLMLNSSALISQFFITFAQIMKS